MLKKPKNQKQTNNKRKPFHPSFSQPRVTTHWKIQLWAVKKLLAHIWWCKGPLKPGLEYVLNIPVKLGNLTAQRDSGREGHTCPCCPVPVQPICGLYLCCWELEAPKFKFRCLWLGWRWRSGRGQLLWAQKGSHPPQRSGSGSPKSFLKGCHSDRPPTWGVIIAPFTLSSPNFAGLFSILCTVDHRLYSGKHCVFHLDALYTRFQFQWKVSAI